MVFGGWAAQLAGSGVTDEAERLSMIAVDTSLTFEPQAGTGFLVQYPHKRRLMML